jgi:hypothetical protein
VRRDKLLIFRPTEPVDQRSDDKSIFVSSLGILNPKKLRWDRIHLALVPKHVDVGANLHLG